MAHIYGFIESNNWSFGGENEIIDGYYINEDGSNGNHVLDEYEIEG